LARGMGWPVRGEFGLPSSGGTPRARCLEIQLSKWIPIIKIVEPVGPRLFNRALALKRGGGVKVSHKHSHGFGVGGENGYHPDLNRIRARGRGRRRKQVLRDDLFWAVL
jgi:hypothetical protein